MMPLKRILCEAYSLLFDIETTFKSTIAQSMRKQYSHHWRSRLHESINLNQCYLYELLTIIFRYPQAFAKYQPNKDQFHSLIQIRNKICHMQPLNDSEFLLLRECHSLILNNSPILT